MLLFRVAEVATEAQLNNAAILLCQRKASGYTHQCTGYRLEAFKTTPAALPAAAAMLAVAG
jgi:hypothetical protein